jgi:polyhydroxyalkanoate synthesis regulator phasin
MEFADLERRPEQAPEQNIWETLPDNVFGDDSPAPIPGYGGDYGKNIPGLRTFNLHELPYSEPSREEVEARARESGSDSKAVAAPKDTRIAQSFAGESGVQWDPISELFVVIIGGVIAGAKASWDAANDLYQHVMKSTHDHGGGKNEQHGKKKAQPSKEQQLKDAEGKLEELKRNQGPKKEKDALKKRIENLKKEVAKDIKGEAHRIKPPGSNGQVKR